MSSYLPAASGLRIGGLASGIDTDSIIKDLMKAQRIPVDKLKQNKQVFQWQQEGYREINNSLRAFRDKVFNMKLQATYLAKKAASSNEAAFTAVAATKSTIGLAAAAAGRKSAIDFKLISLAERAAASSSRTGFFPSA